MEIGKVLRFVELLRSVNVLCVLSSAKYVLQPMRYENPEKEQIKFQQYTIQGLICLIIDSC